MRSSTIYSALGVSALFLSCIVLYFFHDLSYSELRKNFTLGTDGVEMVSVGEDLHPKFLPWEPLEKNFGLNDMLEQLCLKSGKKDSCYTDKEARFRIFSQEHRITAMDGTSYVLERNTVPILPTEITPALLLQRLKLMAAWAKTNQRTDGSFPYQYDPSSETYPPGDYIIRQLVMVQGMFAIANTLDDSALKATAIRAETNILRRYSRTDSRGNSYLIDVKGDAPLGATALGVLMMREHQKGEALTSTERRFGEYILRMQRSDGSFQTFLDTATSTQDEEFYSGEALTALARLFAMNKDERYAAAIQRGYEYYRPKIENDFKPQYAPWHIQAYTYAYEQTHDEHYADYVYWLADGLIETMLRNDPHTLADETGRFFNPQYPSWGPPHSSSTGIYTEGISYAYVLAEVRGDVTRMQKYRAAALAGARSLLLVQWTSDAAYYLKYPERVVGSFKVTITDNRGRIDQIGHAGNALSRVQAIISDTRK